VKPPTTIMTDIPIPSILYRNNVVSGISIAYSQIINYVPRVLAQLSKYSIIKWFLIELNINYSWLLMLLVAIL